MGIDLSNYEVVDVKGGQGEIGIEAVKWFLGKADILMKG
jgi:hypothetical protein